MSAGTYQLPYRCGNCDQPFQADIPRGETAPATVKCPHCGCDTGRREQRRARDDSWPRRDRPWRQVPSYRPMCHVGGAIAPMRGGYGEGA